MFDIQYVFEPPKPIKKTEYYCDKMFHIDTIVKLYEQPDMCGLIFINGEKCQLFTVDITNNDKLKCGNVNTYLKQHHKGGSSSARFGRLHDEKVVKYLKEISEEARTTFKHVDKIVVGGISKRPDQLTQYLHTDVSAKIIGHIVMTQIDDAAILKMIELSNKFQSEKELIYLKDFIDIVEGKSVKGKAIYGDKDIEHSFENCEISKLYVCSKYCDIDDAHANVRDYQKKCEEIGAEYIEIGVSQKAQEFYNMFGPVFGVSWSYIC